MAIATDATSDGGYGASGGLTFALTTGAISNGLIVVSAFGADGSDSVTGITYAGSALTKIGSREVFAGGRYVSLWYRLGPATGANNVVLSVSGGDCGAVAATYSGVKQSAQPDASATNQTGSGTSLNGTVTTVEDNCWLIMAGFAPSCAAGTGTTKRQDWALNSGMALFDSNGPITPAGSASLQMTFPSLGGGDAAALVIASFAPDTGGGAATYHNLTLLGVGG